MDRYSAQCTTRLDLSLFRCSINLSTNTVVSAGSSCCAENLNKIPRDKGCGEMNKLSADDVNVESCMFKRNNIVIRDFQIFPQRLHVTISILSRTDTISPFSSTKVS